MDSDTKKYLAIGVGAVAGILTLIFLKNKIEESNFKPLERAQVVSIIKKSKKLNFNVLKQISAMAANIGMQMQTKIVDPNMVKGYLESPQSPFNPTESFEKNFREICQENNVQYSAFNDSVEYYLKKEDQEIQILVESQERDYQLSLSGKMPQPKVEVPATLTKERLIEIQQKLTLKKYLIQVQVFRKLRGRSQQELMSNPDLMKTLPNQETEEQKILEEEGLGVNDDPASAVFAAGVLQFKSDERFKQSLVKIDNDYKKIFNRYVQKMQSNKITEEELNDLEDELIYSREGY